MSEMIERVVEAISAAEKTWWASNTEGGPSLQQIVARDAIEAMREPTQEMSDAAVERPGQMSYADVWRTMIDAALR